MGGGRREREAASAFQWLCSRAVSEQFRFDPSGVRSASNRSFLFRARPMRFCFPPISTPISRKTHSPGGRRGRNIPPPPASLPRSVSLMAASQSLGNGSEKTTGTRSSAPPLQIETRLKLHRIQFDLGTFQNRQSDVTSDPTARKSPLENARWGGGGGGRLGGCSPHSNGK